MNTKEFIVVQTTCPSKVEASGIAKALVEKNLAACVQISEIESYYIWEDEFCNDKEYILNIKTRKENFEKIQNIIKNLHSYDLPEIIAMKIEYMSEEYKNFIDENTK